MAQVYKALKDFEINGERVTAGEEIVLTTRDGENHTKEGNVVLSDRELDLNDPKDIALDAAANSRKEKKEKDSADAEDSRQKEVDEREGARDEARAEKLGKASTLLIQKKGEAEMPSRFEGMTEEELDKEIVELESMPDMPVETAKYKITGKAEYTDEEGNVQGELEIGSIQELPVVVGERFIVEGVAEAYVEETMPSEPAKPERRRTAR